MQFSFLFELYKLYLQEGDCNKELLSSVMAFFIKNSIFLYKRLEKESIIVKEGEILLDYISKIIDALANPRNLHLKLEEQEFFKEFLVEFS